MRYAAALLVVTGCRAVFGLEPPDQQVSDAPSPGDGNRTIDARPGDASLGKCSSSNTDLVACFDFEGSTVDLAPSANGVSVQNVTYGAGHSGQAAVLDTSSRIQISDSLQLDISAFTIEAWVYMTVRPSARAGVWDTDGQYAMFIDSAGNISCTTGGAQLGTGSVPLTTWVHVACTAQGGSLGIYVDGVKKLAGTYSNSIPTTPTNGAELGGNAPDGLDRFTGKLDLVRVYRRALTQQEICADAGC